MSTPLAVITGAAGGLGKSFAKHLAARKWNLLLTDINPDRLKEIAQELEMQNGVLVKIQSADLTDQEQLSKLTDKLKAINQIDLLVNCAGFGEGEMFCEEKVERQLKMIQLHITATILIVHAILPRMIKRRNGKIITVASLSAFIPSPGSSIYAATKAFLNSFMESLHMEASQHGIRVQSLCPGLTHTEFHFKLKKEGMRSGLSKAIPFMKPDKVVRHSLGCLDEGEVVCVPGLFNKMVKKVLPLFPRSIFYSLSKKIAKMN